MEMMEERAKILVVEDERIVAEDIQQNLEHLGYAVTNIASSEKMALKYIEESPPNLILMDVVLKGPGSGIEAARSIRNQYDIPIIYLTAHADEQTLDHAKKTEPYGYLLKPFEERELESAIETALYKHKMEKILKSREALLSTTLNSIMDGVITTDSQEIVTFINPVAENCTGWLSENACGQPLYSVFRVIDETTQKQIDLPGVELLRRKNTYTSKENLILHAKDDRIVPIDFSASLIRDEAGRETGVVIVFQDITERRQAEAEKQKMQDQLLQAQKMEAIGKLAGGIAHDFNTLLTAILGSTDMALLKLGKEAPAYMDLKDAQTAAGYAADLTRQLLLFSRKHRIERKSLNLNNPIRDSLKLMTRLIGENITIESHLDPHLWTISADRGAMEQVVMNLAVNARDAMSGGGRLVIKTENVELNSPDSEFIQDGAGGKHVLVTVEDTGSGMDCEAVEHIFEPFYTTKELGKGTGLGLSVVYGIVQQHEGWIRVQSEPGHGTIFRIFFPADGTHESEKEQESGFSMETFKGNGEKILVVEDGKGARDFMRKALERGGYIVKAAKNAEEAIDLFQQNRGDFDLVISDVELPDKTGIELVDCLRQNKPAIRVLLCSGYMDQMSRWPVIEERGYHFLQKPYGFDDLLRTVMEVLA